MNQVHNHAMSAPAGSGNRADTIDGGMSVGRYRVLMAAIAAACAAAIGWFALGAGPGIALTPLEAVVAPVAFVALTGIAVGMLALPTAGLRYLRPFFKLIGAAVLLALLYDGLTNPASNIGLYLIWFPAYYTGIMISPERNLSFRVGVVFFALNVIMVAWFSAAGPLPWDHAHMRAIQVALLCQAVVMAAFYGARVSRAAQAAAQERNQQLEQRARDMREQAAHAHEARQLAESANRAKSQFLSTMSHELRTPLNAIIGFSEILEGEANYPGLAVKREEYLHDIRVSAVHLLDIINDILDIARIESGKVQLVEEPTDLACVIEAVITLTGPKAAARGVALHAVLADQPVGLHADERLVKQILINLVSNAVKFTDRGGVVTVGVNEGDDGGVALYVADTGIGIPEHDLARVTQPFYQVENPYARNYEGTGLGLSLVQSFVELHGGTLAIASALGKGTTVTVGFPPARSLRRATAGDDWVMPPAA